MYHASATLESFVVALREGVEVALVIGVLLAHLNRTGRRSYNRYVLFGLAAAGLASLGGAVVVHRYGLDPENPVAEGSLMFVAAALVTSLLVWMRRTGRSVRRQLEYRLEALVEDAQTTAVASRAALGVFGFAFAMVLREGVETVLFLSALSGTPGGSALATLGGGGLGFMLAALFGVLLVRGSLDVNLHRFFAVTGLVLLALVAKLVASGLHEFFEAGVLPSAPLVEQTVQLLATRTASLIILALLIAVPLGGLAWDRVRTLRAPAQPNGART